MRRDGPVDDPPDAGGTAGRAEMEIGLTTIDRRNFAGDLPLHAIALHARAPLAMLERKADELNYKLKFRGEVDPGPEFWQKWADHDADGNPIYVELVEEQVLYEKNKANEILEDLYHAGKIGPNDMAVFENEEPSKKHWSRRVHTLERIADKLDLLIKSNQSPSDD